jgi:hypothetical protein
MRETLVSILAHFFHDKHGKNNIEKKTNSERTGYTNDTITNNID